MDIRYFFNASSMFWEPVIYGGCDAKENNFLRAEDCKRTAVALLAVEVRQGQAGGGKGWGKSSGGHTEPQNLTVTFPLPAAQEKRLPCLMKPYTEHGLQGPAWQRVTVTNPS